MSKIKDELAYTFIANTKMEKKCYECASVIPKGSKAWIMLDFSLEHFNLGYSCACCKTQKEGGGPWTSGQ